MEELFVESGFESNLVRAKRIKWNRKKKSRDTGRNKCAILNKKHEENVCPWWCRKGWCYGSVRG